MESERGRAAEKTGMFRSVVGVIDRIKSEILKNCLVGWCSKFWRAADLAKKLHDEGIKDASIMRLSGTVFLLIFKDHERLVSFMKEHEGALKKWFRSVQEWQEELPDCNRRADDAVENQKLNDEFEGQGEESAESSTENLVVEKIAEGKESLRADMEHLEATTVPSENVLCQDERVTNVILNEKERSFDLEGYCPADIVTREKVAGFAREDHEEAAIFFETIQRIPGEVQTNDLESRGDVFVPRLCSNEVNVSPDCSLSISHDGVEGCYLLQTKSACPGGSVGVGNFFHVDNTTRFIEDISLMGMEASATMFHSKSNVEGETRN
ncbi:hypothetical protein V6N11_038799 [Hibiscus sabdariffa]|uniref:Uncharacterized protein n=1 Tax=Hibiscus sabdariffa TaxID=183260 RepID=A0ABR2SL13_9ROSI